MIARVTSDPAAFKDLAFPFLRGDPVLNTAILSNTADWIRGILTDRTSNKIYATIGCRPAADFTTYTFT